MGSFHLFMHPKLCKTIFGKVHLLIHFSLIFGPKEAHFQGKMWLLSGQKWLAMGLKRGHCTCLCTPNGLASVSEKHMFDPFLVAKQPLFKAFCDFGVAKMSCNGPKKGSFHFLRHHKWSSIIIGKTPF